MDFLDDHLKKAYFYRVFWAFSILFVFLFFCFYFSNIKKTKTKKMQLSFRKPHFWHPQNVAKKKTIFWHNVTLFVFSKIPKKHYKNGETVRKKNLDQFLTLSLDQFLTLKPPNLGPINFTTYYIYIKRKIAKKISIASDFRSQGKIARAFWGGKGRFLGPKNCCDFFTCVRTSQS